MQLDNEFDDDVGILGRHVESSHLESQVFILLDASDEHKDRQLSEHVVALHSGGSPLEGYPW